MSKNKLREETLSIIGAIQADGNQELVLSQYCDFFVVSCVSAGTGTLAFSVKMIEDGGWEDLIVASAQEEIDVNSSVLSFKFSGYAYSIRVEPDSMSTTYNVYIQQGAS